MARTTLCFIEELADGKSAVRAKEICDSIGRGGLDKRKACVFLALVAIGVLCVCALVYMLFFAPPHANTTIKNGEYSLARQDSRFSIETTNPGIPSSEKMLGEAEEGAVTDADMVS